MGFGIAGMLLASVMVAAYCDTCAARLDPIYKQAHVGLGTALCSVYSGDKPAGTRLLSLWHGRGKNKQHYPSMRLESCSAVPYA